MNNEENYLPITCSWHVFTNSESTNPWFFFHEIFLVFFKQGRNLILRSNMLLKLIIFTKKILCSSFKRNWNIICENFCIFVDSEFVKICHEQAKCVCWLVNLKSMEELVLLLCKILSLNYTVTTITTYNTTYKVQWKQRRAIESHEWNRAVNEKII